MNNGRDCAHGRQVGKCDTCDLIEAEKEIEALKVYLRACTGIPASVGICEPIEGYAERPVDLKPAMRDMAKMINELQGWVEQLRGLLIRVVKSEEYIFDFDLIVAVSSDLVSEISEAIEATPTQCLAARDAEIKAKAIEEAATYLSESVPDQTHESVIFKDRYVYISTRYMREYANQLRQSKEQK